MTSHGFVIQCSRAKWPAIVLLVVFVTYIGKSEAVRPQRYPFAIAQDTCGPADGPAFQIYFTAKQIGCETANAPFLSITVNEAVPKSGPKDYSIGSDAHLVSAVRCLRSIACESATSGIVHLTRIHNRESISGDYEIHFQDGTIEKASFEAKWCVTRLLCG